MLEKSQQNALNPTPTESPPYVMKHAKLTTNKTGLELVGKTAKMATPIMDGPASKMLSIFTSKNLTSQAQ